VREVDVKMQENKRKDMLEFLKNENDYITYLLEAFEVPETAESEWKT
jgi:hypothetical protein